MSREDNIYYARLAEQGERYEDMIRYMKQVSNVSSSYLWYFFSQDFKLYVYFKTIKTHILIDLDKYKSSLKSIEWAGVVKRGA
jgi:hypothetical protein